MHRVASLILAVAVLVGAGCLGNSSDSDDETGPGGSTSPSDGTTGPTTSPTDEPTTPYPNPELTSLRFEECWGGLPTFDVPDDWAEPYVPLQDFNVRGFAPGSTHLNVLALICDRIVVGDAVKEDVALMLSWASVSPRNETWENQSLSFWPFDILVADELIADAFVQAGANAEVATFRRETTPVSDQADQEVWSFDNDRVTYEVLFHFPGNPERTETEFGIHYWSGANPYNRTDVKQVYDYLGIVPSFDEGTLTIEGDSAMREILHSSMFPVGVEPIASLYWEIPALPQVFAIAR